MPVPYQQCHLKKSNKPPTFLTTRQPAEEFKRGIKRDKAHYTPFKESKQWYDWRRSTLATARSHCCEEIFNPTYTPKTPEEKDLFIEKQNLYTPSLMIVC